METLTGTSNFTALDQSGAIVSLYYDDNTASFDGTLITRMPASAAASFTFKFLDFANLASKPYFFYAVANDGVNPPVYSDYSGPLTPPLKPSPTIDLTVSTELQDGTGNSVPFLQPGDMVQIKLTAKNVSTTKDATMVNVANALPAGVASVTATASVGAFNAGTNTWNIGPLGKGVTATLTLKGTVRNDIVLTQLSSTPAISALEPELAAGNNQGAAVLPVSKLITVNNAVDETNATDNMISLREAINQANSDLTSNYVIKPMGGLGPITLAMGPIPVLGNVNLVGPGALSLTISANDASRIFGVSAGGTLTISGLTLTKGKATGLSGGAIQNAGTLSLSKVVVSASNSDEDGGAIYNTGVLVVDQSTFSMNKSKANGGAISSVKGSLTMTATMLDANEANLNGGGVYVQDRDDSITGGTFTGNKALGKVGTIAYGGAIAVKNGHLAVSGSTFTGNKAPIGGALEVFTSSTSPPAVIDLQGDTFTSNEASSTFDNLTNRAGAIASYGGSLVRIDNSSFATNKASNTTGSVQTINGQSVDTSKQPKGGAIYNGVKGNLVITRSTFTGNSAPRQSGAIDNAGTVLITESTFSGNTTPGFGGAIDTKGRVTLKSSTIAGNNMAAGGGGVALFSNLTQDGTLYIGSSIVAGNTGGAAPDVSVFTASVISFPAKPGVQAGAVRSLGFNLIGLGDPAVAWKSTDIFGKTGTLLDPKLGSLASNGGTTQTFLPAGDSPAINRGKPNPGDAKDQRGNDRVKGGASDIGSVETDSTVINPLPPSTSAGTNPEEAPATADNPASNAQSFLLLPLVAGTGTITVIDTSFVEGTAGTFDATFDDPGSTDDASAYTVMVDWGDGSPVSTSAPDVVLSGTAGSYTLTGSHTYADEGTFHATITISKNGADNIQPVMIMVGDADVLATDANSPATVTGIEGTMLNQVVVARFDDTGVPDRPADHFTATIKWGDKITTTGTIARVDPGNGDPAYYEVTGSHLYTEDDTYAITVTIKDGNDGQTLAIPVSAVIGEDPTFTVNPSATITTQNGTPTGPALKEGTTMTNVLLATFQHANGKENAADFVATIDWGDGTSSDSNGTVTLNGSSYEVRGSHTYTEDRDWPITITIADTVDTEIEPDSPPVTVTTNAVVQEDTFVTTGGQSLTGHTGESLDNVILATFEHSDGWENPTIDFQVTINWGDGTPADDSSSIAFVREDDITGIYTIFGSHVYTAASPPGGYQITITITDVSSSDDLSQPPVQATVSGDTATITTVNAPPTITSPNNTTFIVGTAGSFPVTTHSVGPVAVLTETDNLPPNSGISFHDNGDGTATIAGTPAVGTGGGYTFNIVASNGILPNGTQTFTLNVNEAPSITSADHVTFPVSKLGIFTVTTHGFPTHVVLTESDNLPAGSGISFHDNGDGTATIAGTPTLAAAGSFTFNITADNGVAPAATQALTLAVTATGTNLAFVQALYQTVLGRPGPTADVNAWVAALNAGLPRIEVAKGFWESVEHRGIQVRGYYSTYLHRTPTPVEVQGWVSIFRGGATESDVMQGFVLSTEYLQAQDSDTAFVRGLYQDVLGRPADAPGLAFWLQGLQDSVSRTTVAHAFLTLPEELKHTVDIDYATLLQRPADPAEEQVWIKALATGFSPSSIAEQFLASDEFFARF